MNDRQKLIHDRLQPLHPINLLITDESHLHIGHSGSANGAGHFSVAIESDDFNGLSAVKRHRLVYNALAGLMDFEIHAISINAFTSEEKLRKQQ